MSSGYCSKCGDNLNEYSLDLKQSSSKDDIDSTLDSGITADMSLCGMCSSFMASPTELDSGIDLQVKTLSIESTDSCHFDSGLGRELRPEEETEIRSPGFNSEEYIRSLIDALNPDEDGDTALHLAVIQEFYDAVNQLLKVIPEEFLNILNYMCQTPLHLAVLTHQPQIVRNLLSAGASRIIRDRNGNTPLHLACIRGDLACAKELINTSNCKNMNQITQNLEIRNYEGQTCFHLATLGGHLPVLELLKKNANVNAQEWKTGRTALHLAIEMRNFKTIKYLVEVCHSNLNARTFGGLAPAQQAYFYFPESVSFLTKRGSSWHSSSSSSETESDSDIEMKDTAAVAAY